MKRLLTFALLGILGVAGLSYSQEIPDGVKEFMNQLQNDPTTKYGFDEAKKMKFIDQNVQFQDWYVGLPFQFYNLNIENLETATIDTKFEDLIKPLNKWCIPIKVKENYVYHVFVEVDKERFNPYGCGEDVIGFKTWDKVRINFPEESGIMPIFIAYPYQLLIFPHKKDGKNIFYARNPKWDDFMSRATSKSLNNLDDAKTIIPLLQDNIKNYKEQRKVLDQQKKEFKKNHENSANMSGGEK
jgi:hypothetical protein